MLFLLDGSRQIYKHIIFVCIYLTLAEQTQGILTKRYALGAEMHVCLVFLTDWMHRCMYRVLIKVYWSVLNSVETIRGIWTNHVWAVSGLPGRRRQHLAQSARERDVTDGETRAAAITQQRVHEEGREREESTENPPTTDSRDRQKTSIGHHRE